MIIQIREVYLAFHKINYEMNFESQGLNYEQRNDISDTFFQIWMIARRISTELKLQNKQKTLVNWAVGLDLDPVARCCQVTPQNRAHCKAIELRPVVYVTMVFLSIQFNSEVKCK